MAILNPNELKAMSRDRIAACGDRTGKLVLLFTGVSVALTMAVSGLNLYLSEQISNTGGLGGLGMRSVLQTIQTLLSYFNTFFSPFWQAGFVYAMICVARNMMPEYSNMGRGLKRFGSVLSLSLLVNILISLLQRRLSR